MGKVRIRPVRDGKPVRANRSGMEMRPGGTEMWTGKVRCSVHCEMPPAAHRPASKMGGSTKMSCTAEMWSRRKMRASAARMSGKMRPTATRVSTTSGMPASRPGNTGVSRDAERKTDRANANCDLPHLEIPMGRVAQRKISLTGQRQDRTACSQAAAAF